MKKSVCIVLCFYLITLSVAALDLGDLEYEVITSRRENGQQIYEGIDQYGNKLTLVGTENLSDDSRKALQVMLATFNSWEHLTIDTQRVVITKKRTEMALIPESFEYEGVNLSEYMPSGMQFYYTNYLEYDFRLYKDNLFLRMSGQLYDEEQFCEKLLKALENPVLYIQTHNPDYLIEQIALISEELETTKRELTAFREQYQEEYDSLMEELLSLKDGTDDLREEYKLLRNAVVAFANRGLFQLLSPVDSETEQAVIAAKKASPDATSKELASQLKEEGVDVSARSVAIIFAVYFNDFEE